MAFAFTPTNANTLSVQIGINHLLTGYIVQSEDINESTQTLEIADQKGRTAQVIAYDKGNSISLTAIGPATPPCRAGQTLSWYDVSGTALSCIVTSCRRTCSYNDTAKWQIDGTAYAHASYSDKTEDSI